VNGQDATAHHVASPAAIIFQGGIQAVAAIDEDHGQRGLPVFGGRRRVRHQWYHDIVQSRGVDVAPELPERVHHPLTSIVQVGVVKKLPLLVFFRAPMMIQGEHRGALLPAGKAQVDGAPATITTDFQHRTHGAGLPRVLVQRLGLIVGEETLDLVDIVWQSGNHVAVSRCSGRGWAS